MNRTLQHIIDLLIHVCKVQDKQASIFKPFATISTVHLNPLPDNDPAQVKGLPGRVETTGCKRDKLTSRPTRDSGLPESLEDRQSGFSSDRCCSQTLLTCIPQQTIMACLILHQHQTTTVAHLIVKLQFLNPSSQLSGYCRLRPSKDLQTKMTAGKKPKPMVQDVLFYLTSTTWSKV